MRDDKGHPLDESTDLAPSLSLSHQPPAWQQIEEDIVQAFPHERFAKSKSQKRAPQTALEPLRNTRQLVRDRLDQRIKNRGSLRRVNETMDMLEDRARREKSRNIW